MRKNIRPSCFPILEDAVVNRWSFQDFGLRDRKDRGCPGGNHWRDLCIGQARLHLVDGRPVEVVLVLVLVVVAEGLGGN